jgi:hypothetical protein
MLGLARLTEKGWGKKALSFLALATVSVGCAWQNYETLDIRPKAMAPVQTVAIATIAARPSLAQSIFGGSRGELVGVLAKFESELTTALTSQGFNVINISQSGLIYNSGNLEYEIGYLHNTEDFMARSRGEDQVHAEARKLRTHASLLTGTITDKGTFLNPRDRIDQITSPNTRIFAEIGVDYRFSLPRYTEKGGAFDNRFMSDAARLSIGEITREMGADAYILIDASLLLSARKEGYILTGLTGGTRYVTLDGTAALVRNDGAILSVDWTRSQSEIPVGGTNQMNFTPERDKGVTGFQVTPNLPNLREGAYQVIRTAAFDIAGRYAKYRAEGVKQVEAARQK